jgi:hypothetical protein
MGLILCEVEDRRLWEQLDDPATGAPYSTFERWVVTRAPVSRSHAFAAKGAMRALRDVPVADLVEMPQYAIKALQRLSPGARAEAIEAAKTMGERELGAHLASAYPEQHIDTVWERRLRFQESVRGPVTEAMEAAMWAYDVKSWEEAVECLCAYFLDGKCEREECGAMSNREAREAYEGKV